MGLEDQYEEADGSPKAQRPASQEVIPPVSPIDRLLRVLYFIDFFVFLLPFIAQRLARRQCYRSIKGDPDPQPDRKRHLLRSDERQRLHLLRHRPIHHRTPSQHLDRDQP